MNVEAPCLSATRPIPACEAVIKLAINSGSSKSCVPESTLCDNNGQIVQSCLQLNSGGIGAESSKIADCRAGCQTGVALCLIAQPLGQFNEFLKTKKTKKSLLDWNFFFCFVFCFLKTDRTNEPTKTPLKENDQGVCPGSMLEKKFSPRLVCKDSQICRCDSKSCACGTSEKQSWSSNCCNCGCPSCEILCNQLGVCFVLLCWIFSVNQFLEDSVLLCSVSKDWKFLSTQNIFNTDCRIAVLW